MRIRLRESDRLVAVVHHQRQLARQPARKNPPGQQVERQRDDAQHGQVPRIGAQARPFAPQGRWKGVANAAHRECSALEDDRHAGPQPGHRRGRAQPDLEGAQIGAARARARQVANAGSADTALTLNCALTFSAGMLAWCSESLT